MAVFFGGGFLQAMKHETTRRIRRDIAESPFRHGHEVFHHTARKSFESLGAKRVTSGRSKLQAVSAPKSKATGSSSSQKSSSGNQSRNSVAHGRNSAKNGSTSGTTGTSGTSGTSSGSRTRGTQGTRPTIYQRYSPTGVGRNNGRGNRRRLNFQAGI